MAEQRYYSKVIRVRAEDSPNVRLGLAEERLGLTPSNTVVVDGVLTFEEYKKRRQFWDKVRQCIGLDGLFWKGSELLLFPPDWLTHAERIDEQVRKEHRYRTAKAIGCDPGEGVAESAWYVIDDYGILEEFCAITPDTTDVPLHTERLIKKWSVPAEMVMLDRGGGGKQHADLLRKRGFPVRTILFGESVQPALRRGKPIKPLQHRVEEQEERTVYFNRRAELFGRLSDLLDPSLQSANNRVFGIPAYCRELRRQLAPFPKKYDAESRLKLPPKNRTNENSKEKTLTELIGCSPDRADALAIAVYCRDFVVRRTTAGVA